MIGYTLTPLIAYMSKLQKKPAQQHKIVVEQSAKESGGKYSLLYIEAAPGVNNPMQYHKKISKTFEVLEGNVTVEMYNQKKVLKKGERLTIRPGVPHRIYSNTGKVSKMYAMVMPGHLGYEEFVAEQFNADKHDKDSETINKTCIEADSYRESN
ncbi:MAG TPA: cupin domain-containing protein [Bacteroidia bacterium]|jgi:mannose-6-phosphate isomerase-like protein (cupin superfamily)|nr:cupin domain-containing protein [Bacteroidia bacterium]